MRRPRALLAVLAGTLVLGLAVGPAFAAADNPTNDPTASQYSSPANIGVGGVGGQNTPGTGTAGTGASGAAPAGSAGSSAVSGSSGSLPFTGLDLVALLAVAIALTAAGLVLRRVSRREETAA